MSRRKTINDAVDQAGIKWGQDPYRVINVVTRAAAYAYDMGRTVGLMEGANMAMADGGWTPVIGGIKRKARAMRKALKQ